MNVKVNVKVDPRSRALQEDEVECAVRGLLHLVPVKRPAASYMLPRPGRDIAPRMSYPLGQHGRMVERLKVTVGFNVLGKNA